MSNGQWILVCAVVAAVVFGLWRARTDGRFRAANRNLPGAGESVGASTGASAGASTGESAGDSTGESTGAPEVADLGDRSEPAGRVAPVASVLAGTPFADQLGERATFVQFSSAFCAPCRVTRRTLEEVTALLPDVAHIEIDAELHLDLVRTVNVLRTPTTLVLDAAGREVTRAAGAPTKAQVLQALALVGEGK